VRAIYFYLLGFNEVEVGLLLSFATAVSAIHHITFGMLSDRFGRKIFFILGGIFSTLRMVIFAISSNFWMLVLGQGFGAMGEGAGAGQPVVSGYISDKTDFRQRSSIFSTLAVINALAATFGSFLAGLPAYFQKTLGLDVIAAHSLLFWIGGLGSFIALLFVLPMQEVKPKLFKADEVKKSSGKRSWGVIARFSLVRSMSGLGWGFIQSLMSLYFFKQFGVGGEVLGPIYALARFISIFSYVLIPMFVSRLGDVLTIVASRLITAVIALIFAFVKWYPLAVVLMIIFRIVIMFTMPIRQTFATGIVDPEETATAIGISNFSRMSVRTVAPTIAGYMFQSISMNMPFIIGAGLLVVNGLLFKIFFQPRKRAR
jgi:DHA1 family multidrug resistance protein-like MFS transporter